jgi:hypothetical protein
MLRGLVPILIFCTVVALLLGLTLSGSEWLNPKTGAAKADQMEAQTDALRQRTEKQKRLDEIDLNEKQALSDAVVAGELRRQAIVNDGYELAAVVLPFGLFALMFAGAVYIIIRAVERLLPPASRSQSSGEQIGRIIPFPDPNRPRSNAKREPRPDEPPPDDRRRC